MNEPSETPYAAWLGDFLGDDPEPNVKAETDFTTASISADRIGGWHCGGILSTGKPLPVLLPNSTVTCGTISTVPSLLGVGLTLKTELEKARARIADLEGQLSTAQQRIAAMESKPVEVIDDQDCWMMPRSLLPRGL